MCLCPTKVIHFYLPGMFLVESERDVRPGAGEAIDDSKLVAAIGEFKDPEIGVMWSEDADVAECSGLDIDSSSFKNRQ